jgi:hypothetical protein
VQALAQRLLSQQGVDLRQHLAVAAGVEVVIERDFGRGRACLYRCDGIGGEAV